MAMVREIESLSSSSSDSKLIESRSDGDYMYMFIEQCAGAGYILYRIDILKHLLNKPMAADTTQQLYDDLQPLLVFPEPVLPSYFRCAKLNSTIYIIPGEDDAKFGFEGSQPTDVYVIRESDIMDIQPSEGNIGQLYLMKIACLNGFKSYPTIFEAENKLLYVLSDSPSSANDFEVYSPDTDTWRVLPPRPADSYWGIVTCCVVLGKTVYFSTNPYTLQSFHLEQEKWSTIFFNPTPGFERRDIDKSFAAYPVLRPPVIIEGMAFGVLERFRFHIDSTQTICASRLPCLHEDGGDFKSSSSSSSEEEEYYYYLRPSIAPDEEFMHALTSSRCPHVSDKKRECFSSEYVVALDAEQVLCSISYGSGPPQNNDWNIDRHTSYATLTFFKVAPGFYLKECKQGCSDACHHPDYASQKINGEYMATRFFNAKHQHNAHFIIKTNSLHINGRIHSCLL